MKLIKQALLHYQQGSSDRVFEVYLCEVGAGRYVINTRFGRRGGALREGTETARPLPLAEAEWLFTKVVAAKVEKGYQEGAPAARPAAAATGQGTAPAAAGQGAASARTPHPGPASPPPGADARAGRVLARLWQTGAPASVRPIVRPGVRPGDRSARGRRERKPWPLERAIWRAGELRLPEAVPQLCQLVGSGPALRDYCLAFALGRCAQAGGAIERERAGEALSGLLRSSSDAVRRAAALGLRGLTEGAERDEMARNLAERLPPALGRAALGDSAAELSAALSTHLAGPGRDRYEALFTLYLILKPELRPALLDALRAIPLRGGSFRAIRHLFKAAEIEEDAELFGLLAYRFEKEAPTFRRVGRYPWRYLTTDGKRLREDEVRRGVTDPAGRLAFGDKTRDYLRRRVWRTLRRLGRLGDPRYVNFAVGVLLPFTDADAVAERTRSSWRRGRSETVVIADRWAPYWAFNHVLHGESDGHRPDARRTRFRLAPAADAARPLVDGRRTQISQAAPRPSTAGGAREAGRADPRTPRRPERFPRLWEQRPEGLLHLLAESGCEPVHVFAARALRVCRAFLAQLDSEAVVLLLGRPYEVTAELGYELALERYRPEEPDLPMLLALAGCVFAPARAQAHRWIDERRERFLGDGDFVLGLCTSPQADTRAFALRLLRSATLPSAQAEPLIARLIAYVLALGEGRGAEARDIGAILLGAFAGPLRSVGTNVVMDLLQHPLREVQEIGGQLLLQHEKGAWAWPEPLLLALILSPFESMRGIGVRFLGQLPDEALRARQRLLVELAAHAQPDLRNAVRPLLRRVAAAYQDLGQELTLLLSAELLKREPFEGVHASLVRALREDLGAHLGALPRHRALELVAAPSKPAQDLGAQLLLATPAWADEMDMVEVVRLGSHELLAVRQAALAMFERLVPRARGSAEEMLKATRLLDARWDDTRAAAFQLFRERFSEAELTPGILIAICDSVREDVQRFGRELLARHFDDAHGEEYLDRLSEHPTADMQLLVTNYLQRYAAGDLGRLRALTPYFVSALSRVNRARVAKARIYDFLEAEGQRSPEAAEIVLAILGRLSATISVEGRARCLEAMVEIGRARPEARLPITVKAPPVRDTDRDKDTGAEARRAV